MASFSDVSKLIEDKNGSVKKVTTADIKLAEKKLNIWFSNDLKILLTQFGAISVNYFETLAPINKNGWDIIKETESLREHFEGAKPEYIGISDLGNGDIWVYDNKTGEVLYASHELEFPFKENVKTYKNIPTFLYEEINKTEL